MTSERRERRRNTIRREIDLWTRIANHLAEFEHPDPPPDAYLLIRDVRLRRLRGMARIAARRSGR